MLSGADRIKKVNAVDNMLRSAAMFAAYYNNSDAIELVAASDANLMLMDSRGRTAMHYATLVDNSKVIETIFMSSKGSQHAVT